MKWEDRVPFIMLQIMLALCKAHYYVGIISLMPRWERLDPPILPYPDQNFVAECIAFTSSSGEDEMVGIALLS